MLRETALLAGAFAAGNHSQARNPRHQSISWTVLYKKETIAQIIFKNTSLSIRIQ